MKTIGLIGGMSWESTVPYYRDDQRGRSNRNSWAACIRPSWCWSAWISMRSSACSGRVTGTKPAGAAGRGAQSWSAPEPTSWFFVPTLCTRWPRPSSLPCRSPAAHCRPDGAGHPARRCHHGGPAGYPLHHGAGLLPPAFGARPRPDRADTERRRPRLGASDHLRGKLCLGEVKPASRDTYLRVIETLRDQGAQAIILVAPKLACSLSRSTAPWLCLIPPACMPRAPPLGH